MPWDLTGNGGIGANNYLGTRNAAPLLILTENGQGNPTPAAEVMRFTAAAGGRKVGIKTQNPLFPLHVTAGGGFGPEDGNGVAQAGNVPIVAQSDSTALGVLNSQGRQAFALNIDANGDTSNARGVPTLYDRYDGNWHSCLSLRNGNVGVGTPTPANRLDVNGDLALMGRHALRGSDPWLRLNQDGAFPSGTHTPGLFAPGSLNVGGVGGWGNPGPGNVQIAGRLATNGLGVGNNPPGSNDPGFPSWSGGGVNTFDVFARGALYTGTNIEDPEVQIYSSGTLIAKDKRFRINHPLDPENRFLVHACVEGPENAIYYRGQGELKDGISVVKLPDYFEALALPGHRTVTLTPCCQDNEPISILAATEVVNGHFKVRTSDGSNPAQRFFWEVKAVRADVDRLEPEIAKDACAVVSHQRVVSII